MRVYQGKGTEKRKEETKMTIKEKLILIAEIEKRNNERIKEFLKKQKKEEK